MNHVSSPAVAWTATIGLIPGYGHNNDPDEIERGRQLLIASWSDAMEHTLADTGFSVSAVLNESTVLYPRGGGCPTGGERAMTLSGSSNPAHVAPDRFDAFRDAVVDTVQRVQSRMQQTTVRIEFSKIDRSVYSRLG